MTATPTPEALRHRAAARRWALSLMVLFTAASMAFNVVIAARHGGAIEDLVLAGLAPAVLASMGHLLAKFVQAAIEASGVTSHVYWAGVAGVSIIGFGAFVLSFENLQTLAARQHNTFVAGVFPVTLDLAILVSTGIHVVIGIANENDQSRGVEPYRGWLSRRFGQWNSPAQTLEVPPAGQVEQPIASREAHTPESAGHDTEQPSVPLAPAAAQEVAPRAVPTPDTVAEHRDTEPAEQSVTCDVTRKTGDVPTEPITVPRRTEVTEQPAVFRETQPVETAVLDTVYRDSATDYVAEQDDEFARTAEQLVTAGRTQAPVEMAAAVLRGADRGVTVRELAEATGISPSGVSRITKAAKALIAEPEPALA